jgi:hypothetical protein
MTTDYSSVNPNVPTSNYGYTSGYHPNDNAPIQKSKILELNNLASHNYRNKGNDEMEIRQLQQEVNRLRNIVQNY